MRAVLAALAWFRESDYQHKHRCSCSCFGIGSRFAFPALGRDDLSSRELLKNGSGACGPGLGSFDVWGQACRTGDGTGGLDNKTALAFETGPARRRLNAI